MTDSQPPSAPSANRAGEPADLTSRFLARLIDHVILAIVVYAVVFPLVLASIFTGANFGFFGTFSLAGFVAGIVSAALIIGYFALMESNSGQTVGKMVIGLRTEGPNGEKPTMEEAVKRNAWYALSIVPILGGLAQLAAAIYIAVTINNTGTGWHDTFAGGTKVVRTR